MKHTKKKKKNVLRTVLILVALILLLFSAHRLAGFLAEYRESREAYADLSAQYVTAAVPDAPSEGESPIPQNPVNPETVPTVAEELPEKTVTAPFTVDFDALREKYPDVVAWVYCEGTPINYPVVQGRTNSDYLRALPDGTWNLAGCIFLDARNTDDFSAPHSIVYGHNMQDDQMFGSLEKYREQSYYEEHPTMFLLTPSGDYLVELYAAFVTDGYDPLYDIPATEESLAALSRHASENSTFTAEVKIEEGERLLTLSTCAYDHNNARYLVAGVLRPVG